VKTLAQPDSRLPLYQQLKEMFLDEISSGGWKIGTTIPSELEIATRFNVSRATVRQAVMDLVHTGHLRRIQGKGTIVTEAKIEPLAALTSFSENMKAAGITPGWRTFVVEWKSPPPQIAERLQQPNGRALYLLVDRPAQGFIHQGISGSAFSIRDLANKVRSHFAYGGRNY
jgi:GntR family transcriptional regulator